MPLSDEEWLQVTTKDLVKELCSRMDALVVVGFKSMREGHMRYMEKCVGNPIVVAGLIDVIRERVHDLRGDWFEEVDIDDI